MHASLAYYTIFLDVRGHRYNYINHILRIVCLFVMYGAVLTGQLTMTNTYGE